MTGVTDGVRIAARQQVDGVLLVVDHDRVAGVVAAVEPHAVVDLVAEQVGGLALTLVTPLGADEHDRGHRRAFLEMTDLLKGRDPEIASATGASCERGYPIRVNNGGNSAACAAGGRAARGELITLGSRIGPGQVYSPA